MQLARRACLVCMPGLSPTKEKMKPAIEWLHEVAEVVSDSMFSKEHPPGQSVLRLIERIQADASNAPPPVPSSKTCSACGKTIAPQCDYCIECLGENDDGWEDAEHLKGE